MHPFRVAKSSTNFSCGKGGNVTSAGWQVILRGAIWHVSSRSGEAGLLTRGEPLYRVYLLLHLLTFCTNEHFVRWKSRFATKKSQFNGGFAGRNEIRVSANMGRPTIKGTALPIQLQRWVCGGDADCWPITLDTCRNTWNSLFCS